MSASVKNPGMSELDELCAKKAGVPLVAYNNQSLNADFHITNLKEIENKILSMQKQLKELDKRLKLSGKISQSTSKSVSPAKSPKKIIPKKPGKIIEKDL